MPSSLVGVNPSSEIDVNINANNTQITCTYCGKGGHTESISFKKNGFPSNHEGKNSRNYTKHTCTHGGRNEHKVDVCNRKHGFPSGHKFFNSKANYVKVNESKHEEKHDNMSGEQDMCLRQQQDQTLLALLRSR